MTVIVPMRAALGFAAIILVSSPAIEPRTPSRALRSSADATTCAHPGGVRITTRLPEQSTEPTHSPIIRRRWSTGAADTVGAEAMTMRREP